MKYWLATLSILLLLLIPIGYAARGGTLDPQIKVFSANNMSLIQGQFDNKIIGKFKNISNQTLYVTDILIDSYDSKNKLIGVDKGSPSYSELHPGQVSSFKVDVDLNTAVNLDHFVVGIPSSDVKPTSIFDLANLSKNITGSN